MNPIAAIEPVPANAALSALQASAGALPTVGSDAAEAGGAHGDRPTLEPGALATPAAADDAAMNATALPNGVAEAQAQQGLATLGRMAAESSRVQGPSPGMLADAVAPPATAPDAPPRPELLSVPVFMPPWQPPAADRTPWPARPETQRHAPPRPEAEPEDDDEPARREPGEREEPPSDLDAEASWLALLRQHEQHSVLLEVARGRRVLLVLPHAAATRGAVPATALMLGATHAPRWRCRWWPGSSAIEAKTWHLYRVFRADAADHLLIGRTGALPCRVVLGPWLPKVNDPQRATLEIAERQRFVRALGVQWSVTLLVAPPGLESAGA